MLQAKQPRWMRSPLTDVQSVLMNFTGGHSMSLSEITEAAETITQEIHGSPTVILGAVVNDHPDFDDESIKVTVIATGFTEQPGANIEATHTREKYGSRGREQRRPTSLTPRSATPERSRAPKPAYQDPRYQNLVQYC